MKVNFTHRIDSEIDGGMRKAAKDTRRSLIGYVEHALDNQLKKDLGEDWREKIKEL
jgi:hypothetical protein